jgi:hypothetical protein
MTGKMNRLQDIQHLYSPCTYLLHYIYETDKRVDLRRLLTDNYTRCCRSRTREAVESGHRDQTDVIDSSPEFEVAKTIQKRKTSNTSDRRFDETV